MATSPLFGWEEPDDVDLVKDGAAAIRTLGNAIDTSMGDLLGGTTGQVLAKASNTNMDFTWVAQDDSNAIQNAIVDAKGDLIAATAADTPARLAVGTNGHVVRANSATATGLEYAPSYGSTISIQRGTSNQTITANAWTKIQLNSEDLDTDGSYDPTTNYRFTPKVAGYYQFNTLIFMSQQTGTNLNNFALYKNGAFYALIGLDYNVGPKGQPVIAAANGSTDYFEWYLYASSTNAVIENRSGGSPTTVTWLRGL